MNIPSCSYRSDSLPENCTGDYRFGFNGMERVDEISGVGNHYTAEYWEMDPRVLRRWNTDPVVKHWESPYAIFHNNPIFFTDPQGDDPPEKTKKHKIEKGETLSGIAKKTGASVDDLMNWNKGSIKDKDKIFEGDEINISDPKRWTLDEGSWIDSQNPDELWASTGDGGWTNINAQTFGEWFGETWNQPVGYISDDGEMTIGKNSEAAEAMMQIVPPMISWGATVYANPRLPKVSGSSGFQHLGSWQKGGNFGHFSSYNGAGFSFKTSHSFYRAHASGSFSSTKLTIRQVESSIARNAYHNIHKIPKAGNGYFPGSVNIDGVNVGYRAVINRGSVEITTYFPKLH
jgi:LysM repeat protein